MKLFRLSSLLLFFIFAFSVAAQEKSPIVIPSGPVLAPQGPPLVSNNWPVDATLEYSYCARGQCNPSHPIISGTVNWGPGTSSRRIFAGTQVVFGPFHLTRGIVTADSGNSTVQPPPATFHVEVWARSPAFYTADGHFAGANLQLRKIASATKVLSGTDDLTTADLFVPATLPGAITSLQFRVTINSTLRTSSFPPNCGDLPPLGGSASLDDACMQAGVNPLAILNPHFAPLAIIYEPPGNCSFAKLTQTDVVGTTLSAQDTQSNSTNTLVDPDIIATVDGANQQNFTWQHTTPDTRLAKLVLSQSQTFGTALSSGLPDSCNQPGANAPPRPNSGPGKGDIFLLLVNQPLIYWDQGGLSNFLFAGSQGSQLLVVPAWELMTPAGLQKLQNENHVTLTTDEANAILALDPLVVTQEDALQGIGPFANPALPKRFIPLDQPSISLPSDTAAEFSVTRDEIVSADNQSCFLTNSGTTTDSTGLTAKLGVLAGKTALSFAIGDAVGNDKIGDALKDVSASDLLGNTKTTVNIGLSSCKGLQNLAENANTQNAFLKDTNTGINVAAYYDAFFGTTAYVPLAIGMGQVLSPEILALNLPNFVWNVPISATKDASAAMPAELKTKLNALGFVSLSAVPLTAHGALRNASKGLLPGVQLDAKSGALSGKVLPSAPKNAQALYLVLNKDEKPVAQLWINGALTP